MNHDETLPDCSANRRKIDDVSIIAINKLKVLKSLLRTTTVTSNMHPFLFLSILITISNVASQTESRDKPNTRKRGMEMMKTFDTPLLSITPIQADSSPNKTDFIISARGRLIKMSSQFEVIENITVDDDITVVHPLQSRNIAEPSFLACRRSGRCHIHTSANISNAKEIVRESDPSRHLASSAMTVIASQGDHIVIASDYDGTPLDPTILAFHLPFQSDRSLASANDRILLKNITYLDVRKSFKKKYRRGFVYSFIYNNYVYFIRNYRFPNCDSDNLSGTCPTELNNEVRIGRVHIEDMDYEKYTEMNVECGDIYLKDNVKFRATAAVLGQDGVVETFIDILYPEDILYIAISLAGIDIETSSRICGYPMKRFEEYWSRRSVRDPMVIIKLNQTNVTSIAAGVTRQGLSSILVGTSSGELIEDIPYLKIFEYIKQNGPAIKSIALDKNNEYVYFIHDRNVTLLLVDPCATLKTCSACTVEGCLWCGDGCVGSEYCEEANCNSTCPPIIRSFYPTKSPISTPLKMSIKGEDFGKVVSNRLKAKGIIVPIPPYVTIADEPCIVEKVDLDEDEVTETIICNVENAPQEEKYGHIHINMSYERFGAATSHENFTFVDIVVDSVDLPSITSIGEKEISITGRHLNTEDKKVLFGNVSCTETFSNISHLFCRMTPNDIALFGNKTVDLPLIFQFPGGPLNTTQSLKIDLTKSTKGTSFPTWLIIVIVVSSLSTTSLITALVGVRRYKRQRGLHPRADENLYIGGNGTITSVIEYLNDYGYLLTGNPLVPLEEIPFQVFLNSEILKELRKDGKLIDQNEITLGKELGTGHFGCVYVAILRDSGHDSGRKVAVKTIRESAIFTSDDVIMFIKEAMAMKDFDHTNVLHLIGLSFDGNTPLLVLPFMENGALLNFLKDESRHLTIGDLIRFATEIAQGMEYLAEQKFVHRDLAVRNCMLDEGLHVKVADFGLARDVYQDGVYQCHHRTQLPVRWMAPECLSSMTFTVKSDVWSFGVVLWELMTRGALPYPSLPNDSEIILSYLSDGKRLPQPTLCPHPIYQIMLSCWSWNEESRPSFTSIISELELTVHRIIFDSSHPVTTARTYVNEIANQDYDDCQ